LLAFARVNTSRDIIDPKRGTATLLDYAPDRAVMIDLEGSYEDTYHLLGVE
jgi:hypothetical protein